MKIYLSAILFFFIFKNLTAQNPIATNPGGLSTATGASFNIPDENFQVFDFVGYKENRLIKYIMKDIPRIDEVTHDKQRKFLDSLRNKRIKYLENGVIKNNAEAPGVVAIKENFYIDEIEVTNFHWQEFLYYIKRDSSAQFYNQMIPDEDIVKLAKQDFFEFGGYESGMEVIIREDTYFMHPAYRYFPVVGVSYEQVQAYCKWRSDFASEVYNQRYAGKDYKVKFNYRLPTEEEWELVASCGYDKKTYPLGQYVDPIGYIKVDPKAADYLISKIENPPSKEIVTADIKKYNKSNPKDLYFNCKRDLPYFLQFSTPFYVYNAPPNDFGVYNMIGNVAEMVLEKGIAKGGSYKDTLEDCEITDRIYYTSISDKVGFRCACEIEILKK